MNETIEQSKKAIELAPAASLPYAMLAMADAQLGKRSEALQAADNAVHFAKSPSVVATAASAVSQVGQRQHAKDLLNLALEMAQKRYVCRFIVAAAYSELGEKEQALDSLELGYSQRST